MCDLHQLHAALASTLTPNQQERQTAEQVLKTLQTAPGYLTALFTVVSSVEAKQEVRQAGAIYFKNLVLKHWDNRPERDRDDPDAVIFAEEEKASVRALLLDSLLSSTHQTRFVFLCVGFRPFLCFLCETRHKFLQVQGFVSLRSARFVIVRRDRDFRG